MQLLLTKNSGRRHLKIDFTENGNFKEFNSLVKKYLLKNKGEKIVEVIDYIYPLTALQKNIYQITNHINLSGFNPLTGPNFISLGNIYTSSNGIVVCGLKENVHPNVHEKKVLLSANVKAYCYNIVPTAIFATSLGLKIKAFGIVQVRE